MKHEKMIAEEKAGAVIGIFFALIVFWLLISLINGISRVQTRTREMSRSMPLEVARFWINK